MAKRSSGESSSKLNAAMRVVVLHGSELFLVRERSKLLADVLEEQFGGLEQFSFDGDRVELAAVLDELRSYGLMQRHKLVTLDNADDFLTNHEERRRALESYAANPVAEATLLMRAGTWKPGNLDKAIAKSGGAVVKCEPVSNDKAVQWCIDRCAKRYDCTIKMDAAAQLVKRIGSDLGRLDGELAKMASYIGAGAAIDLDIVNLLTQPTREEKAWELQGPLASGSVRESLEKLGELLEVSRVEPVLVTWAIADLLRKVHLAAQLIRSGVPEYAAARQARFWGDSGNAMMSAARHVPPSTLAQLLRRAVEADRQHKSGQRDERHSLEELTILVADSMR